MRKALRAALLGPVVALASAWAVAALYFDAPAPFGIAIGLIFVAVTAAVFVRLRPFGRALTVWLMGFLLVLGWWLSLEPSNERTWLADVAHPPTATIDGDHVTVHNVRHFDYRSETDFTPRWETREYDLSRIEGVDLFLSYWGSPWIAHTIVSWQFEDGPPLAVSIETRKEDGEEYSAVRGFFRQYELYYVAADERDLVRLRTSFRGEDVYLYRMATDAETARALLVDYLRVMNRLADEPRWYNALTHNCTTVIRRHVDHVAPGNPFDWRILVNGKLDELGYERGNIATELPFAEMRERSNVVEEARAAGDSADFSRRIRIGLPARPGRSEGGRG